MEKLQENNLFFDIESVKGEFNLTINDFKAASNVKDPVKILAQQQAKLKEAEDKAGLNSFTAKICSICWAFGDGEIFEATGINEIELLVAFNDSLATQYKKDNNRFFTWIGHNITGFDLPFLYHRAVKYKLHFLKQMLPSSNRSNRIQDTMLLSNPFEYKPLISLDKACKYFGVETPKDGMTGADVQKYYNAGRFKEIGQYCTKDVEAERALYKLLM